MSLLCELKRAFITTSSSLVITCASLVDSMAIAQDACHKHLSHLERKALMQNTGTREDHLKLATCYRARASQLHQQAEELASSQSRYATNLGYSPKQYPSAYEQSKRFAISIERTAETAAALAATQQQIADSLHP
jgi:hypothetical protein